jgi:hypothetical protein
MMAVVPGISRNSRWMLVELVAVVHLHVVAHRHAFVLLGLVGDDDQLLHALGVQALGMICSTEWPSGRSPTCWPPVMATASL